MAIFDEKVRCGPLVLLHERRSDLALAIIKRILDLVEAVVLLLQLQDGVQV